MNKKCISFVFLLGIILILNSMGLSKGEYQKDAINLSTIIQQLEQGNNMELDNIRITGNMPEGVRDIKPVLEITNSTIDADLNFIGTNFSSPVKFVGDVFNCPITFNNCNFEKDVDFSGTHFDEYASFSNTSFLREANLSHSFFQNDAIFCSLTISNKGIDLSNSAFIEDADFSNAIFKGLAKFTNASFSSDATFSSSKFFEEPDFTNATFNGKSLFDKVTFLGGCNFQNASFGDFANFADARSEGLLFSFDKAKFSDDADFTKAIIGSIAYFNASFNQDAIFEGTQFNNRADFTGARFTKDARFNESQSLDMDMRDSHFSGNVSFDNTIIKGYLILDKADFHRELEGKDYLQRLLQGLKAIWQKRYPGRVSLNGAKYNRLFVNWADLDGLLVFDDNAYTTLEENFKSQGKIKDANDCYYEYKVLSSKNLHQNLLDPSNWLYILADAFYWLFCGYGVKPAWTVYWSLLAITFFALYFWRNGDMKIESAIIFSATTFLSGTGRLFVSKPDYSPSKNIRRSICMFTIERIFGGTLIVLFIISISKTVTI